MKSKKSLITVFSCFFLLFTNLHASTFFSGYAGGKVNYSANQEANEYDPDLKLQAFFAGQFNFSQNLWTHLEFSIDTKDFLNESIFHATDALFQIDELSAIFRGNMDTATNYISLFMGTYDPIGSDIFLQRYFSIDPIASKITESYLGLAGSILYPHFGLGIADVLRLHAAPVAIGTYLYFNHEDKKYYVFNADLRTACVTRYFTCDFAAGVGAPLADKYKGEAVIIAIEKLYWHAGTTILIGNNYTHSFFIQAGLYNATYKPNKNSLVVKPNDIYLLLEPRFLVNNFHINISLYSLPSDTVKKLLFIEDTLGMNFHVYTEEMMILNKNYTLGSHFSISFKDKYLSDMQSPSTFKRDNMNINLTPYVQTNFLSGELHFQFCMKIAQMVRGEGSKAFSADIGYRTSF